MDDEEVGAIVERLERIDRLRRDDAPATVLLEELRALLDEAEAWSDAEGSEAGERAVTRLRAALCAPALAAGGIGARGVLGERDPADT